MEGIHETSDCLWCLLSNGSHSNLLCGVFLSYMINGILFYAADAPPGDISETGKLLFSVGIPAVYSFVLFGLYYLYRNILKVFNIHLRLSVGILLHTISAIYLIWNIVPYAFN